MIFSSHVYAFLAVRAMPATPRLLSLAHPFRGGQLLHGLHQALRLQWIVYREACARFCSRWSSCRFSNAKYNFASGFKLWINFNAAVTKLNLVSVFINLSVRVFRRCMNRFCGPDCGFFTGDYGGGQWRGLAFATNDNIQFHSLFFSVYPAGVVACRCFKCNITLQYVNTYFLK